MRRLLPLLAAAAMLLCGCSTSIVPEPVRPATSERQLPNRNLVENLRGKWERLKDPNLTDEERRSLVQAYNADLLLLVRRLRYEAYYTDDSTFDDFKRHVDTLHVAIPIDSLGTVYEDLVPAQDVKFENLEEHYAAEGLGVPMVGVVPPAVAEKLSEGSMAPVRTKGTVSTLTAVMVFPERAGNAHPQLRLVTRLTEETCRVGKLEYQLAADFSAPMEVYWRLAFEDRKRFLGLLHPQKLRDTTGLSSIQPYNPNKIPVILTHGLLSDASTFGQLVNRLYVDPEIRNNFQFWYFNYPTGPAWVYSAMLYRDALAAVRNKVDPRRRNRNWDNMVVVGHSMGGLITRYSQCVEPWKMLIESGAVDPNKADKLTARYIDHPFEDAQAETFRRQYFFRPVEAGMVVYMATPHRGAPIASLRIVHALTGLIALPFSVVNEAVNLATLQRDLFLLHPDEMSHWFTSLDQLSPEGYSIIGLQGLAMRNVPVVSIIGNRGSSRPLAQTSDGLVPFWSSHLNLGEEFIVPHGHSVQEHKDTAEIMKIILHEHLQEHPPMRNLKLPKEPLPLAA